MPRCDDDCPLEHRLDAAERRADAQSERITRAESQLGDGRVQFAELRKDLQALNASLQQVLAELRAAQAARPTAWDKVRDAAIHWGVPVVIGALLFAVARSGQIPGVAP
jgi:uncharacterized coiled-coil protein SlyX